MIQDWCVNEFDTEDKILLLLCKCLTTFGTIWWNIHENKNIETLSAAPKKVMKIWTANSRWYGALPTRAMIMIRKDNRLEHRPLVPKSNLKTIKYISKYIRCWLTWLHRTAKNGKNVWKTENIAYRDTELLWLPSKPRWCSDNKTAQFKSGFFQHFLTEFWKKGGREANIGAAHINPTLPPPLCQVMTSSELA